MRLLIFAYPWLELLSLIQLGVETSALTAVAWVMAMMLLGGALLRRVGTAGIQRLRQAQQTGILQQHLLVDDMAMAFAGILFIVPGLLSDFFAVVVLVGPLRRVLARLLGLQNALSPEQKAGHSRDNVTLEGSFEVVDDNPNDGSRINSDTEQGDSN
jgi:UPF0716 protein FxsA